MAELPCHAMCGRMTVVIKAEPLYGVGFMPVSQRREVLEAARIRWLDLGFRKRILPFDSAAAPAYAGTAAAPLPSGPTDQRRRLSDRRYVPLTPSRSGNAQPAGLRGYGSHCHRSLVGRSIDPACAPSTAPTGATGSRGTVLEQRAAEVADEAVGRGATVFV